jgi:hypothetical protein
LESAHQQHAERAKQAFDQLAQEAAALEHRQARYEALQVKGKGGGAAAAVAGAAMMLLLASSCRSDRA